MAHNPRDQADFDRRRDYAEILNADVIALQEVENEAAVERVFDPSKYQIFVETRNDTQRTGFAIRRGIAGIRKPDAFGVFLRLERAGDPA